MSVTQSISLGYNEDMQLVSTALDADGTSATGASMRLDIGASSGGDAVLSLTSGTYGTETSSGTWQFSVPRAILAAALSEGRTYRYTLWTITSDSRWIVRASGSFTLTATVEPA